MVMVGSSTRFKRQLDFFVAVSSFPAALGPTHLIRNIVYMWSLIARDPKTFYIGSIFYQKKKTKLLKEVEERTMGQWLCELQQRRPKQRSTQKFSLHPSSNEGKSWRSCQLELHCQGEGEVLRCDVPQHNTGPQHGLVSAVTNLSCLSILEQRSDSWKQNWLPAPIPLLKYTLTTSWVLKKERTGQHWWLPKATQSLLERPCGFQTAPHILDPRQGTHPQAPKDMFPPQISQQNNYSLCQELLQPCGYGYTACTF